MFIVATAFNTQGPFVYVTNDWTVAWQEFFGDIAKGYATTVRRADTPSLYVSWHPKTGIKL